MIENYFFKDFESKSIIKRIYTKIKKGYKEGLQFNLEVKIKKHEKKVDEFYSAGLNLKGYENDLAHNKKDRFLSFGYWNEDTQNYFEAAKNLLNFFIENSKVKKVDRILNVACGYGSETFEYYRKFKPNFIEGIDATRIHVDYANERARLIKLDKKVKFVHGDACVLDFPEESFSHLFGIEGPANFNTREKFFKSAYRVLKKGGKLILTDVILGEKFDRKKILQRIVLGFSTKCWVVPKENWVTEKDYKKQLEKTGFSVKFIEKIGNKVFPGYANHFFTVKAFNEVRKERGFLNTLGFVIISKILGYLYDKGWIEYIYVKAEKY